MSRHLYLIAYDIGDPKRQRSIRERLSQYRVGGQKSCFECWLTATELRQLLAEFAGMLDPQADRMHCFSLDPRMQVLAAGQAQRFNGNYFMVT